MLALKPAGLIRLFIISRLLAGGALGADTDEIARKAALIEEHYAKWVGVPAPELGPQARDRIFGRTVELKAYRGRRVLLVGLTGESDTVHPPDRKVLAATLEAIRQAREKQGNRIAVIAFTKVFDPGLPPEVPVVTVTNRTFAEPYEMLYGGLGGFVIDTKGVISRVYARPLTPQDILEAAEGADWQGEIRSAPLADPSDGKGPPRPRFRAVKAWARSQVLLGGIGGDWNLDGTPDLITAAQGRLVITDPADGLIIEELQVPSIRGRHEFLLWAEVEKGIGAVLHFPGGWPHTVPIIGKGGKVLWSYPPGRGSGVDSVDWADLDGNGKVELLMGFNGSNGFHVVSSRGEAVWAAKDVGNVWAVSGVEALPGRPGLAFCTSEGKVEVFDAVGRHLRSLDNQGYHVARMAARRMKKQSGDVQVLALGEPPAGQGAVAFGQDPDGKVLWKYPLLRDGPRRPVLAADFSGDEVLEWLLQWPEAGTAIILDSQGTLLLKLDLKERFTAAFPATRKEKPALLCVATPAEVIAFGLEP